MAAHVLVLNEFEAGLDALSRQREQLLRQPVGPERSTRMAESYDAEAELWSQVGERCRTRVYWRAALGAREYALRQARVWRRRAAADQLWSGGGRGAGEVAA